MIIIKAARSDAFIMILLKVLRADTAIFHWGWNPQIWLRGTPWDHETRTEAATGGVL